MIRIKSILLLLFIVLFSGGILQGKAKKDNENILDFLNLRFGMFIHYNMGTYHAEQWAQPNHDPKSFAPTNLDCNQWAAAAKSAKMNYAVLTTKHHDGFCLWNSKTTDYDVASSSYKGDIVKEFVDAFRKQGIKVGLYFSVWDRTHDVAHGSVTPEKIKFTKDQLKELVSNYGKIEYVVIDGWGSKWGNGPDFIDIPFDTLANVVHAIQPNCLVINHSCKTDLSVTQVVHYEATHGQHCPFDNTIPSQQGPTIQPAWFWEKQFATMDLKPLSEIVQELNFANSHNANYLLNAAPNDQGLMDDNVVKRLKEIGEVVQLPKPMKKLPEMKPVHLGVTASASSFNGHEFASKNVIDCNLFTRWQYTPEDTQRWIELDFGKPITFNRVICGEYRSGVEAFKIEAWVDGAWKLLAKGGKMTFNFNAAFPNETAQRYRLTILKASKLPKIAELTFVKY